MYTISTSKAKYVIKKTDGSFVKKTTDFYVDGWFTLEEARKIVDYSKGEMIYESNGKDLLWEIF